MHTDTHISTRIWIYNYAKGKRAHRYATDMHEIRTLAHSHARIYTRMHKGTNAYTYTCTPIRTHTFRHAHIYAHRLAYRQTHIEQRRMHAHINAQRHAHRYIHRANKPYLLFLPFSSLATVSVSVCMSPLFLSVCLSVFCLSICLLSLSVSLSWTSMHTKRNAAVISLHSFI